MDTPETPAETDGTASGKSGMIVKLSVVLFLVAVIVGECVLAYIYTPSPEQAAVAAGLKMPEKQEGELFAEELDEMLDHKQLAEVDLDTFTISTYEPASGSSMRFDFVLYGAILEEEKSDWTKLYGLHERRVREQVIETIRSAEIEDFADAKLGLIKRRLLTKVNETLGKPLLKRVGFEQFSFIEQ